MTRLLVLGLLDEQPMSGYDIQQKMIGADAETWGGVLVGSIYYALKKMEQEELIALTGIEYTGHRQKAVYQITDKGRQYMQKIILDSLQAKSVTYPTKLYSALPLLDKVPRKSALHALHMQKEQLAQEYAILENKNKVNENHQQELSALSKLTIDSMFAIVLQQQHLVDQLIEVLEADA